MSANGGRLKYGRRRERQQIDGSVKFHQLLDIPGAHLLRARCQVGVFARNDCNRTRPHSTFANFMPEEFRLTLIRFATTGIRYHITPELSL